MEKEISLSEYLQARKLVLAYEAQEASRKLSIYDGCTKNDLLINDINSPTAGRRIFYYWVTKGTVIPDRNPDGSIVYDYKCDFYTLEHSHVAYTTFESAYKNMLKTFKRRGFIK